MSAPWGITNRPAVNTAATVSQAAPGAPYQNRLRALQASLSGTAAGIAELVVRDGATGVGAILMSLDVACPVDGVAIVQLSGLDFRSSPGNALTVEFVAAGGANTQQDVNAQGDLIVPGQSYGSNPSGN